MGDCARQMLFADYQTRLKLRPMNLQNVQQVRSLFIDGKSVYYPDIYAINFFFFSYL